MHTVLPFLLAMVATIVLRSWYAGKTVIRASSPGLAAADAVINFKETIPFDKNAVPAKNAKVDITGTITD